MKTLFLVILTPWFALGDVSVQNIKDTVEDARSRLLVDLIALNVKDNGWNNFITFGSLPDSFYKQINALPFTFITSNMNEDDLYIEEEVVPYIPNIIVIDCYNFTNFEESLRKIMNLPYWHPPSRIIITYNKEESKLLIAKMFFSLWFYRASNVIIVQFDDEAVYITKFNPFIVDFDGDIFGCWTENPVTTAVHTFETGFVCEEKCHNVSIQSKHRRLNFGTCIGLHTYKIPYDDRKELSKLNLFKDRGNNMNGFALRALTTNVPPFLTIKKLENGKYELGARDGKIWTTLSELMNFTIDLSASEQVMFGSKFEMNVELVFTMGHRKGDLFLLPIYLFHIVIIDLDYSFPYKDSGNCILAHRAPFETVPFNIKALQENAALIIQYFACFLCIWLVFNLYSVFDKGNITSDQVGKDFLNSLRCAISITIHKPSNRRSFRYFLTIVLWSYFVINFTTQAAITSFLAASKRSKEVETFADVVEKGYRVQGIPTPDAVLPDEDNPIFQKINSKLEPIKNMFDCVDAMTRNDSERFCLIDCSVGRYLMRNYLDEKGEQYLHVAQDRVHNYYLNFVFPQHSVLTESVNKYLMTFYEAGLVKKWEDYRFNNIKEEAKINALGLDEIQNAFTGYFGLLSVTFSVFLLELLTGNLKRLKQR